jgi:hypothetical protein
MNDYMTGPSNPSDTGNHHFFNTFGYVKRPNQSTLDGMQAAIDCVAAITLPKKRKSRPLKIPLRRYTVKIRRDKSKTYLFQKCGPSYFPVEN